MQGGELVVGGDVTPKCHLQPPEMVTRREQRVPVPHAPLLAMWGLSPSGQEKGWDILEAARLCWGHQHWFQHWTLFGLGFFCLQLSGFDTREQLSVRLGL